MKDLIKRIIDTCNYNEMNIDTELSLDYAIMIAQDFANKDIKAISTDVIFPLMQLYRDSEDLDEQLYIKDTVEMLIEYISTFKGE